MKLAVHPVAFLIAFFTLAALAQAQDAPAAPPSPRIPNSLPKRIRLSEGASRNYLFHMVSPVYPSEAKSAGIHGKVVLHAVIGKDGIPKQLASISGPKELFQSAMDAVKQWRYRPFILDGEAIEMETEITVNYPKRH